MNRTILWAVLAIGLALVIAPLALSLPSKASAGERMLGDFQPIMRADQVDTTAYYYDSVFTPLARVVPAMSAQNVARLQQDVDGLQGMTPATRRDFTGMLMLMKANERIFAQVPAGLAHYKPLVTTMQANVTNYRNVNSLPSFRLFTWFFVVPGILLVVLASLGLYGEHHELPSFRRHARPTPA